MLAHFAMHASRVTSRFPTELTKLRGVARPATAPVRRVAAFASWRMGGGGGARDGDDGRDERPSRRSSGGDRQGGRKRFTDHDENIEDYGEGDTGTSVGFAQRRRSSGESNYKRGGRGGGRGGGGRGGRQRNDRERSRNEDRDHEDDGYGVTRSVWQEKHDEKKRNREASGQSTLAETLVGEALFGLNPVKEALLAKRRTIHKIWVQESSEVLSDRSINKCAEVLGLNLETVTKHDLNMLVNQGGGSGRPHNGIVADASSLEPTPIDSLPQWDASKGTSPPVWLALDEVVDPQNLGAILRSAHFLGVDGVVVCAKNSAPLSPVVSKASSGALESFEIKSVGVMHRFLQKASEDGWDVFGAEGSSSAEDAVDVSINKPSILVMGNEGSGLRTNVKRACTRTVRVSRGMMSDSTETSVDSLNVSVATGIILHALLSAARR